MERCGPVEAAMTRASFIGQLGGGAGILALGQLMADEGQGNTPAGNAKTELNGGLHHRARVRRIIQLFMNGGASPMDTFDYKPALERHHGQMLGPKEKPEGFTAPAGAVMKSPFEFRQYGESGRWVSSIFPEQARYVDDMAFLMAMTTKTNVHGPGSYMMNTGFILPGFPCMGAWITYALGDFSAEFPSFVVLPDPRGLPYNSKGNFSAGFLPARNQGTLISLSGKQPIPDLHPESRFRFAQGEADRRAFAAMQKINRRHQDRFPADSQLEARIASAEIAAQMQLKAPEVFDLTQETASVHDAYGLNRTVTEDFGKRCLLARRMLERGCRFVQVWSGPQGAINNWDNHGSIPKELPPIAESVDRPIGALLGDLKQRGMLDDTLVVWSTEFGRTPFAQGGDGRDHNGGAFVTWLAGAGIRSGSRYGESDELGYRAAEGATWCYDLHATILHLLGIDHTRLTFRHSGVDRRLTDVHGHVIGEILA